MSKMTPEQEKWSRVNFRDKLLYFYGNITVEPMIALLVIPSVFSSLAAANLILDKACLVNLQFSEEVCTALRNRDTSHYKSEDAQVSRLVANMATWTSLMTFFPVALVMFAGSWSDRNKKRKPFMLAPIVGEFLCCFSLMASVFFFYQLPMQVSGFFATFFPNITGGWTVMFMAVFSYIADVTKIEMRTVRIGFLDIFSSMGVPLGTALSGVLVTYAGYYGTFSLAAVFYISGLIYGYLHIKETDVVIALSSHNHVTNKNSVKTKDLEANSSNNKKLGTLLFIKDFFDISHVKNTFRVVFNEDCKKTRKRIIFLIIVIITVYGPIFGEMTVMYLYLRYKFNWDAMSFSIFSTYSVIIHLIGTSCSVGFFSYKMKMDDALLGIISCFSKILSGLVYAFAISDWQVYMGPLVSILSGTSGIALRSITSKLVPPQKLGKLNSVFGACEALTPLLYAPMYAFVYTHTINSFPGAFLLLGAALILPAIAIFGWMYTQHRQDKMESNVSKESKKDHLKPSICSDSQISSNS